MKSTWMSLLFTRSSVGLVLDRERVRVAEGDVAGRVLVEQRLVEDGAERADPPLLVDERDLAEPRRTVVARGGRPERVGALVGVDLDRATALELDPDPVDVRAVELERHRRRDVAVDPFRVGRREDLLGREVRVVGQIVDRLEVGAEPLRARHQPDRQIGARPLQVERVEAALGHPVGARDDRLHPLVPRLDRIVAVEPEHVDHLVPELVERRLGLELGVHPLRPVEVGRRPGGPVRRALVDDPRHRGDVRQHVAPRASGVEALEGGTRSCPSA